MLGEATVNELVFSLMLFLSTYLFAGYATCTVS